MEQEAFQGIRVVLWMIGQAFKTVQYPFPLL
jgi:hypothetical protein